MYVNGKMIAVETVPEMGGGRIKENGGRGEFKYDIFDYCKNFCKCHNVPQHNTVIKKRVIRDLKK
jgi:hypothetical protein